MVKIECVVEGINYETIPPYWRKQVGPGMKLSVAREEAVNLFSRIGYTPTQRAASPVEGIHAEKIHDS